MNAMQNARGTVEKSLNSNSIETIHMVTQLNKIIVNEDKCQKILSIEMVSVN